MNFCVDLAKDSIEVLKWLESFNKPDHESPVSVFPGILMLYMTALYYPDSGERCTLELSPNWSPEFVT